MASSRVYVRRSGRWSSFTLIELLVVIAIIAILAGLTLAAAEAVMTHAARSRASAEIQAMSTALEGYKTDNGAYPWTNSAAETTFANTNAYAANDASTVSGPYNVSGQVLYQSLSGKINFLDAPQAGTTKTYMNFKANQLGNTTTAAGSGYSVNSSTYVQDPFGYSYGYYASSDTANPPVNGTGFFDLWSTGGTLETSDKNTPGWQNTWISNWQTQ